ncbi:hypothetical protein GWI33_011226 [Rhynchophorus ferrugineus]|uniref:26S proteasome non-ATPase regulatory subunit 6 n=1 Tax=Rhynchophorus ferrugineus TaxID=354439 RepID=A0A834IKU5_RHYFE|nr:hypothetical protein GWI33_011226 [Rhynchophorus ferrugineus]
MLVLKRADLKTQLITNPDVLQAFNQDHALEEFVFSLYRGDFREFFKSLALMETEMRGDMLLHAHYGYYVKEMKIKAYDQLLSTYISLNLSYMAEQFGVTEEYLENDVYNIISSRRLSYKIDKISGKIVNVQPNRRSHMLDDIFKHGDVLLNRIQKLSRVINI